MRQTIELGDTLKDKHSGLKGVAVARTEFINGCVQYEIQPPAEKGTLPDVVGVDEQALIIVKKAKKSIEEEEPEENGGPNRKGHRIRGY